MPLCVELCQRSAHYRCAYINLWPSLRLGAELSVCVCIPKIGLLVGSQVKNRGPSVCVGVFVCVKMHLTWSMAADNRPFTVGYQRAPRVLCNPHVGCSRQHRNPELSTLSAHWKHLLSALLAPSVRLPPLQLTVGIKSLSG